jgi:hypothetical protein
MSAPRPAPAAGGAAELDRWEALQYRNFRLSTRVGRCAFGNHRPNLTSTPYSEGALGYEVFAAIQTGLAAGPVEPYIELRGSVSAMSTDHLDAHPGGGVFLIGVRGTFE